jgi:hypothetical protein
MKTFSQHFDLFKHKLLNQEPFAFARYSDGEMYILKNIQLKLDQNLIEIDNRKQYGPYLSQDFKNFDPIEHSESREWLLRAYLHRQQGYYKGISCRCCVGEADYQYQLDLHKGDDESLTWANLFVNANYPRFLNELLPIMQTYETIMVCHKDADLSRFEFVVKDFRVGYNAMINDQPIIEDIKTWIDANNVSGKLFLFSASTFSNLAIYELYKHNNNNTYLDIGTCLTPFMNMPIHRSYLQEYWGGAIGNDLKKVCIW